MIFAPSDVYAPFPKAPLLPPSAFLLLPFLSVAEDRVWLIRGLEGFEFFLV
jgi:hypothetical protein